MNFLDIFGNTKVSISDSLFNKNNVKYVSIFHNTCSYFTDKPETEGKIRFVSNDIGGEKTFKRKPRDMGNLLLYFLKVLNLHWKTDI